MNFESHPAALGLCSALADYRPNRSDFCPRLSDFCPNRSDGALSGFSLTLKTQKGRRIVLI